MMDISIPDLNGYAQPEWNRPHSVLLALKAVLTAQDQLSGNAAYNQLLYAIGNNHRGTYWPVALAIMPTLRAVLQAGGPWAQHTVLDALIDVYCSFAPEMEHQHFQGASLEECVQEQIRALGPLVATLATRDDQVGERARELMAALAE
jgi:hypothetical protein